jgi:hypothetical protein
MHPEIDFHKESAAMVPKRREESTFVKIGHKTLQKSEIWSTVN